MTSAWGYSWGRAWRNAWGALEVAIALASGRLLRAAPELREVVLRRQPRDLAAPADARVLVLPRALPRVGTALTELRTVVMPAQALNVTAQTEHRSLSAGLESRLHTVSAPAIPVLAESRKSTAAEARNPSAGVNA